jgi:hypothetical protein
MYKIADLDIFQTLTEHRPLASYKILKTQTIYLYTPSDFLTQSLFCNYFKAFVAKLMTWLLPHQSLALNADNLFTPFIPHRKY